MIDVWLRLVVALFDVCERWEDRLLELVGDWCP